MPQQSKIATLVVTYNRKQLLIECITALSRQTRQANALYIIDNASSDGTCELLLAQGIITALPPEQLTTPWEHCHYHRQLQLEVYYVRLPYNTGGAGGFYHGIKMACWQSYEWLWLMDDDSIPQEDALEQLLKTPKFADPTTGCLGSLVKWIDGSLHNMNAPSFALGNRWLSTVLTDKCVEVKTLTFVACLIRMKAIYQLGLPLKDFFIWGDDLEYTERISTKFRNYCVLNSIVVHKTIDNTLPFVITPENFFKHKYAFRNEIICARYMNGSFAKKLEIIAKIVSKRLWVIITTFRLSAKAWILILQMGKGFVYRRKIEQL